MKPPSVLASFIALGLTRGSLKLAGFGRTTQWARRMAAVGGPGKEGRRALAGHSETAERAARSVAVAAAFFPGRAICLEQSIALYVLLRRRAVAAMLRIGVQPYPFKAHAWVEVDGQPVFENADDLVKFVPFPDREAVLA